jgi:hypothetical protein
MQHPDRDLERAPRVRVSWAALAVIVSFVAGGCGGGGATTTEAPAPRETVDKPPLLPRGWNLLVNRSDGFSIGLPPGWRDIARGPGSLIRSPDHLVAVSLTADRTNEALEAPLDGFAADAIANLPGFAQLRSGRPHRLSARYDAVEVRAIGRATASGVKQDLRLVLERRDRLAAYPILIARNAKLDRGAYRPEIAAMLRSFRGRPIEVVSTGP